MGVIGIGPNQSHKFAPARDSFVQSELRRWDPTIPIERSATPPSSWYTEPQVGVQIPLAFN